VFDLKQPILVFAGEATHNSFYSTVHGAFLSGRKAAYYLLDAHPNQPDDDNKQNDLSLGLKVASNLLNV
jgi:hypothetical protein